jgi:hypothetical protein
MAQAGVCRPELKFDGCEEFGRSGPMLRPEGGILEPPAGIEPATC